MRTSLSIFLVSGALLGTAVAASAAQAGKTYHVTRTMRVLQEPQALPSGDPVAYVCNECAPAAGNTRAGSDEAMTLCKEGSRVTCPSCHQIVTKLRRGPRMNNHRHPEIRYVNDNGKTCVFVAKVAS